MLNGVFVRIWFDDNKAYCIVFRGKNEKKEKFFHKNNLPPPKTTIYPQKVCNNFVKKATARFASPPTPEIQTFDRRGSTHFGQNSWLFTARLLAIHKYFSTYSDYTISIIICGQIWCMLTKAICTVSESEIR